LRDIPLARIWLGFGVPMIFVYRFAKMKKDIPHDAMLRETRYSLEFSGFFEL